MTANEKPEETCHTFNPNLPDGSQAEWLRYFLTNEHGIADKVARVFHPHGKPPDERPIEDRLGELEFELRHVGEADHVAEPITAEQQIELLKLRRRAQAAESRGLRDLLFVVQQHWRLGDGQYWIAWKRVGESWVGGKRIRLTEPQDNVIKRLIQLGGVANIDELIDGANKAAKHLTVKF